MPSLVPALEAFTDPRSEAQLQALDAAVQSIDPASCGRDEINALLEVFERFPEEDGFGVFWGILHALEAIAGYEAELIASVQRRPCEFNVLMVNRLLNAGVHELGGKSLECLLASVQTHAQATPQALRDVQKYLSRHRHE